MTTPLFTNDDAIARFDPVWPGLKLTVPKFDNGNSGAAVGLERRVIRHLVVWVGRRITLSLIGAKRWLGSGLPALLR